MGGNCIKNRANSGGNLENLIRGSLLEIKNLKNHKEYFEIINEKLSRFYKMSQNNPKMISIDESDFSSLNSPCNISNYSLQSIHWKDYFLKYLDKEAQKGIKWVYNLKNLVENESFFAEDKFLCLFFLQEFEINSKLSSKPMTETDDLIKVKESFCSIDIDFYPNYTGSIEDSNQEYKIKVKKYLGLFKDHLFNPDHPINVVTKHFINVFSQYIDESVKLQQSNGAGIIIFTDSRTKSQEITQALRKFIIKLQNCLRMMYCKTINQSIFEEKNEMLNLITNLIFKESQIYENIYCLYELSLRNEISQLKLKLEKFKNITPNECGVDEKFCLNDSTRRFQDKILKPLNEKHKIIEKENSTISDKETSVKRIENVELIHYNNYSTKNFDNREIKIDNQILEYNLNSYCPYSNAIDYLNILKKIHTPYEKMIAIGNISEEIILSINDYWKNFDIKITKNLLIVDADQFMSIIIYVILKSQIPQLLIHLKIIQEFTTSKSKSTKMGYFYITLEASIMYILQLKDEICLNSIKEIIKNSIKENMINDNNSFINIV